MRQQFLSCETLSYGITSITLAGKVSNLQVTRLSVAWHHPLWAHCSGPRIPWGMDNAGSKAVRVAIPRPPTPQIRDRVYLGNRPGWHRSFCRPSCPCFHCVCIRHWTQVIKLAITLYPWSTSLAQKGRVFNFVFLYWVKFWGCFCLVACCFPFWVHKTLSYNPGCLSTP